MGYIMKRYIFIILFMFFIFSFKVSANSLYNIDMNVTLNKDGSARITEVWDMKNSKDTEVYKAMYNLGNMKISNLDVSLGNTKFNYVSNWNINGSFEDKKYKSGFNYTSDGTEICFGISEYGRKKYTFSYDVSNVIFNVEDAQVLYFKFIDYMSVMDDMTYSIKVSGPNTYSDTLDVWGYGVKGYTYVKDGSIYSSNEEKTYLNNKKDYYVMLVKYDLGTFNTNNSYEEYSTFDDVYNKAQDGTYNYDYDEEDDRSIIETIIDLILYVFLPIFIIIFGILKTNKYKFGEAGKKIKMKEINMFRDIPCKKDVFRAYFIAQAYSLNKNNTDFLGTLFLKWIYEDKISVKKEIKKKLLKEKEVTSLVLNENVIFNNGSEKEIYDILYKASGDGILENNEFEKYAKNNYKKVEKWFDNAEAYGRGLYIQDGLVTKNGHKYLIDDKLKTDAIELAGLKKYLLEFASMDTKEAIEVKLWKEYLMYAQIFGIADKVAAQFKKLYPEVINDMSNNNVDIGDVILINNMSTTFVRAVSSARSAAENYSSGGGGFNVGGGGGGSFGGGGGGTR